MNILVLGADGYTGAHLVTELLARGHTVRGVVRDVERGIALERAGMDLRVGDVRDPASLQGLGDEMQVIINLVASCRVEPSESKAVLLEGARNVFRIADRRQLTKYIWASNVSVYGSPKKDDRLTEQSPLKPTYTLGNLTVEAEKLAQTSVPAVTVRVTNIYGPGRDSIQALRQGRIRLLNDGENWQSFIHRDDLTQILIAAVERAAPGSVYLAADDLPVLQRDFFREVAAAVGAPAPLSLEVNAARAFGVFGRAMNALARERQYPLSENVIGLVSGNYYCLNDRIKHELGVALQYPTWRDGYRAMLASSDNG